ncbi:MAG: hypothetical protein A3H06_02020 [Candidatus Colwellbacteria bacterium RIFCSPLOWO2_12_FULL_44_13]|uniref:Uncharacterized protein n=3 Tax=Candidatus Colwelliibacteriota TaxID=1817904 RepID=A0A1G1Z4B0_9BACT|nr:MAG: hypothetical protein A3F24_02670 [Candidatus Colwellbacteria bacterium RIFCSPHIGHO2_12_FULL_44_17]OGY59478.1 MAG: hypothetical protein A3I31_03085 [Candidatus Colwellbacteria bacterium RIFCSPLOWO2_02_FULL_44_20b]OGY61490.1 MAG: hypothetical protein A3H06_02020 [Candidatus Colwellbacteria bacterium RIFCSPLOWO2_12_FULL_44_13]
MLNIPRQKVLERWDELPLSIREALFSEEYDDALERIGEGNSLNEEQAEFLYTDVGDVLRGFLKPTELPKMLEEDLHIPPDIATLISEEVRIKIFDPLGSELTNVYKPFSSTSSSFSSKATPFILHKHEEVVPMEGAHPSAEFERPVFYKEHTFQGTQPSFEEPSVTARLEIGGTPIISEKEEPKSVETPREQERVVHYSELRTPLNPFGGQQSSKNVLDLSKKKDKTSEDGGPHLEGNVVDLS